MKLIKGIESAGVLEVLCDATDEDVCRLLDTGNTTQEIQAYENIKLHLWL